MTWEVPDPVRSAALARPSAPGWLVGGLTWTWAEVDRAVARAAGGLRATGVAAGDVVALRGAPDLDWLTTLFGLLRLGAVAAPLPARAPDEEIERALQALAPDRVVSGRRWHGEPVDDAWHGLDAPALRVRTSGTTGAARAVTLSWGQLVMSAAGTALRLGRDPGDRWLCCLPLHHVGGLMIPLREALGGGSVEVAARFDAAEVAEALDRGDLTGVSLAPAMLAAVLDARSADAPFPPSLRTILVGGERIPPALRERCEGLGAPVVDAWGMTETASHVTLDGAPTPFARVAAGEDGRLEVRGPVAAGRRQTADLGIVGTDGRVWVKGRADGVLTSGGESYHPAEVEDVLAEHPAVGDAAVRPLTDPRWGERPAATLVAAPGADRPSDEELSQWCRERLSRHKLPAVFEWTERLPRKMADA